MMVHVAGAFFGQTLLPLSRIIMSENIETPIVGIKYDSEKPDYSLLPPHALDELVKVLTMGKLKYSRENWRLLEDGENRYFAAAQRHLWALRKGETYDPESGLHHAAHAIACAMFLIELQTIQK